MIIKKTKPQLKAKIGLVFAKSTLNNTIITITDLTGNTICWSSSGVCGFKGSKKNTSFAGQTAAKDAATKAKEYGIQEINFIFSGQADCRDSILQSFLALGFRVTSFKDATNIPYNGCRAPKKRRL